MTASATRAPPVTANAPPSVKSFWTSTTIRALLMAPSSRAGPRGARRAAAPGDGCFADCFAAACARAGFTPRKIYETDIRSCIDLVEAGEAVAFEEVELFEVARSVS